MAYADWCMKRSELTKTDEAILDELKQGHGGKEPWGIATKGYVVDETGFSK